jgi:protoporphyrinogen oxidase
MKIAVIGAGISGISAASLLQQKGHEVIVYEKEERIGGLIQCDWVEGNLFHKVGGHVFNSKLDKVLEWFWSQFEQKEEFYAIKRKAKIWMNNTLIGYPIENYLYQLDDSLLSKIVAELLALQPRDPMRYPSFGEFLRGNFGETLYQIYFQPYNQKVWNTDLKNVSMQWLEGKLPMPNLNEIVLSNIRQREESQMVHSSFYYPKNGGSQFIIDRLARGLDIRLATPVDSVVRKGAGLVLNGNISIDALVYTGDVRKLKAIIDMADVRGNIPAGVHNLRANGTHNVLCYTDDTDLTWLYLPEKDTRAHRIIYTGNFSPANNGTSRKTCVVEFSGRNDESTMTEELRKLPGNLEPIRFNYQPNSYVIQDHDTRDVIAETMAILGPHSIYLCGRFAEWEYYNMDKAIEAAINLVEEIG